MILSWNRVLVLDGELGVFTGDLGGGICGFVARSRASLKTDDIFAYSPLLAKWRNRDRNDSEDRSAMRVALWSIVFVVVDMVSRYGVEVRNAAQV